MNAGVIIFILLLVLAFLGLPIYLSIGIATMVAMVHAGFPLEAVAQKTFPKLLSSLNEMQLSKYIINNTIGYFFKFLRGFYF